MDTAYAALLGQRFPPPLPFHKSLEELRRYFEKFEVPLTLAMERFRVSDALERGAAAYGWRDLLMEEARISRAEYKIFTDSNRRTLVENVRLSQRNSRCRRHCPGSLNAKEFTRRLDITYDDLVRILSTRFVNPDSNLIPRAEKLGVSFGVLNALKNGTITPAAFDALLPTGAGALDPADYGGDIKDWVTERHELLTVDGIDCPRRSNRQFRSVQLRKLGIAPCAADDGPGRHIHATDRGGVR
jgi:hypothetical protein